MLTKNDLKAVGHLVRKVIREEAVTKAEAKSLATKDDLKNFATKDDLRSLATKHDLKKLEKKLDSKFTQLFDVIDKDVMETKRKVKTIEQFLHIPAIS